MAGDVEKEARAAIRQLAETLRELAGGHPVPQAWRDYLDRELGPKPKRGPKPKAEVADRRRRWAAEMVACRLLAEAGASNERPTEAANRIADRDSTATQTFTAQDVFEATSEYGDEARAAEVWRRLNLDEPDADDPDETARHNLRAR